MSNRRRPGGDERAGHDLRVDARRDVAVVRRVPLRRAGRAGVAAGGLVVGRLVDLQAQVRHHERLGLVGDVDDPRGADGVAVAGRAQRALRVLVELEHVRMAVLGERDRVLGDRRRAPGQPADLLGLGIGVARLDLARVEDQHVAAVGSAMYARLPSSLRVMPWARMLPCQIACGCLGSVTSIAVIDGSAVLVA